MSRATNINGFDIVRRYDGSYAVYDYAWWPDEYLDSAQEILEHWLNTTEGWRAKGWQVVYVAPTFSRAVNWVKRVPDDWRFVITEARHE